VGDFQWAKILGYLPDLVRGVGVTLELALISAAMGLVLGLVLALMKYSRVAVLYWPAAVYIEFFRTTPPLVQIVWLYYGLPLLTGYDLGALGAAAVALGLNIAAFYAEIMRAGIIGVHRTQWQAARVLGLNLPDTLR
jgi:His/Glu/Gln/Arg/opine family amino acid ABC transporter permease subunit